MLAEHARHFGCEIRQQLIGGGEGIGAPRVVLRPVSVTMFGCRFAESRALWWDAVCIVEADQTVTLGIVQCQGVPEPVRPLRHWFRAPDIEFHPKAPVEVMDPAVEGHEEFQRVLVGWHPLSVLYHVRIPSDSVACKIRSRVASSRFRSGKRRSHVIHTPYAAFASSSARHTRSGVAGMSI